MRRGSFGFTLRALAQGDRPEGALALALPNLPAAMTFVMRAGMTLATRTS